MERDVKISNTFWKDIRRTVRVYNTIRTNFPDLERVFDRFITAN